MLKPLASWNSELKVWFIEQESLFSEHLELFQAVFPKSGMTVGGRLFELRTLEPLTNESESLSLPTLPTPTAVQARNLTSGRKPGSKHHSGTTLHDLVFNGTLLPTPTIGHIRNYDEEIDDYLQRRQDYHDGKVKGMPGISLGVAIRMELLPTTRVSMAKGATPKEVAAGNPKSRIEAEVLLGETNWGKFSAAIERWEKVIGRKAPAATKPDGKDGSHRLSSLFTEWLMGLPEGWITGHNLSRAEELKMAGNGVVPQQAELALRILLDDTNFE